MPLQQVLDGLHHRWRPADVHIFRGLGQCSRIHRVNAAPQLDREDAEKHGERHLGHRLDKPLRFEPNLSLSPPPGAIYFLQLLSVLADAMENDAHPVHHPLVLKQFEATLINALIMDGQTTCNER